MPGCWAFAGLLLGFWEVAVQHGSISQPALMLLFSSVIKDSRSLPRAKGFGLWQKPDLPNTPSLHHCKIDDCFFSVFFASAAHRPADTLFLPFNNNHVLLRPATYTYFTPPPSIKKALELNPHPPCTSIGLYAKAAPNFQNQQEAQTHTNTHTHSLTQIIHQPCQTPLVPLSRGRWTSSRSRIWSP